MFLHFVNIEYVCFEVFGVLERYIIIPEIKYFVLLDKSFVVPYDDIIIFYNKDNNNEKYYFI